MEPRHNLKGHARIAACVAFWHQAQEPFRISLLAKVIIAWAVLAQASSAAAMTDQSNDAGDVKFNTSFIQGTDQPADLATFLQGNSVVPGRYRVDVYVNRVL